MSNKYPNLFKPIRIGTKMIKNRIIMPPMGEEYVNADGTISEMTIDYYTERAKGGAGIITLSAAAIDWHKSRVDHRQVSLSDGFTVMSISRLANSVHAHGSILITQLHHPGSRAMVEFEGIYSSSPMEKNRYGLPVSGLTTQQTKEIVQKFIAAAKRSKAAGTDGVQVHCGHGYLLTEFLSPYTNHRSDEYGGSLENRARIVVEIIKGIREACGRDFIIDVRLAVMDRVEGGITVEDGIEYAKIVEKAGVDMINITTGITIPTNTSVETQDKPEGHRIDLVKRIKPHVSVPVAIVGKLRSPDMCEELIAEGSTDFVCIGRQLVCDPYWPTKIQEGRLEEIRKCISCSEGCYNRQGIRCTLNPYVGNEGKYQENDLPRAGKVKNVLVVGGGTAGMQAALIASQRGHKVTLLEATDQLGGQLIIASVGPFKEDIQKYNEYMEGELKRNNVEVKFNSKADIDTIEQMKPDKVIVATGSIPAEPPIEGVENAVQSWDILNGNVEMPKNKTVAIIGGGAIGTEVALHMDEFDNQIEIIELTDKLAATQQPTHRVRDLEWIHEKGMGVHLQARVNKIESGCVFFTDKDDKEDSIAADMVVISTGQTSIGRELYGELWERGIQTELCGDSVNVGNIRSANAAGFIAGYNA